MQAFFPQAARPLCLELCLDSIISETHFVSSSNVEYLLLAFDLLDSYSMNVTLNRRFILLPDSVQTLEPDKKDCLEASKAAVKLGNAIHQLVISHTQ